MKLSVLVLACFLVIPFSLNAGTTISSNANSGEFKSENLYGKPEKRKIRRLRGKTQLKNLKGGVLLIRLKTDANRIAALEKKGQYEKAEKVRSFRKKYNQRVVNAFRQNYKFSDMLFFYNTDSGKLKNGQYRGIFLDDSLNINPAIELDTAKFWLIGEFDVLEADTAKHRESTYWNPDTRKIEYTYWTSSANFSRRSLVVRDQNFIQLKRPFPYYISCQNEDSDDPLVQTAGYAVKRTIEKAVVKFEKKLNRKYKRYIKSVTILTS